MRKKTFRYVAALALSAAVVMSLGGCGSDSTSSDDTEDVADDGSGNVGTAVYKYDEFTVGDKLYSDDKCTITISSLDTNDDGSSVLTLTGTSDYDVSIGINASSYDTDEFEKMIEDNENGGNSMILTVGSITHITEEGETEFELEFEFDATYEYYDISIFEYSEFLTEDTYEDAEPESTLYTATFKLSSAE